MGLTICVLLDDHIRDVVIAVQAFGVTCIRAIVHISRKIVVLSELDILSLDRSICIASMAAKSDCKQLTTQRRVHLLSLGRLCPALALSASSIPRL